MNVVLKPVVSPIKGEALKGLRRLPNVYGQHTRDYTLSTLIPEQL